MTYYLSTILDGSFSDIIDRVKAALKTEGFGVLSEIDIAATLKEKLGEYFRPYVILGACNPALAHRALLVEDKIGVLLPCNVVVQDHGDKIEVAAVNPETSLGSVRNPELVDTANEVKHRLERVIAAL